MLYFNPRAPYGARQPHGQQQPETHPISIHAPHTGRDQALIGAVPAGFISIHAPHTGRDASSASPYIILTISIHAPHTGRDLDEINAQSLALEFQSTRPIRGATNTTSRRITKCLNFNPRAPYGARRTYGPRMVRADPISIHAPHTGRDFFTAAFHTVGMKFQSTRPIRGATRCPEGEWLAQLKFQSTRPIRGATVS